MTPKLVIILGICAAISSTGAVMAWNVNQVEVAPVVTRERLLPDLVDKANDVAEVEIRQGDKTLKLARTADGWQATPSGYPVAAEKLRKAIVSMAQMTKLEARTNDAAKYSALQLGGPGEPKTKGREFVLRDNHQQLVSDVVVGRLMPGRAGQGKNGQYVRLKEDAQSWLVAGAVHGGAKLADWVDPEIIALNIDTVIKARIMHADGEVLEVYRTGTTAQGTPKFDISGGVPKGKKIKSAIGVRYVATDLANLRLQDVRKAKPGGQAVSEVELSFSTGMIINLQLFKDDGRNWLTVLVIMPGSDTKAAEKIKKTATGWQFGLASYKENQLQKRLADLVEDAK